MFVVYLQPRMENGQFTVFEKYQPAYDHAQKMIDGESDSAEIYEVEIGPDIPESKRARAAKAALQMGEGILVRILGQRANAKQIDQAESARRMKQLRIDLGLD